MCIRKCIIIAAIIFVSNLRPAAAATIEWVTDSSFDPISWTIQFSKDQPDSPPERVTRNAWGQLAVGDLDITNPEDTSIIAKSEAMVFNTESTIAAGEVSFSRSFRIVDRDPTNATPTVKIDGELVRTGSGKNGITGMMELGNPFFLPEASWSLFLEITSTNVGDVIADVMFTPSAGSFTSSFDLTSSGSEQWWPSEVQEVMVPVDYRAMVGGDENTIFTLHGTLETVAQITGLGAVTDFLIGDTLDTYTTQELWDIYAETSETGGLDTSGDFESMLWETTLIGYARSNLFDTLELEVSVNGAPVPEPATIALLGIGLVGLAGAEVRRRRKKKAVDKS